MGNIEDFAAQLAGEDFQKQLAAENPYFNVRQAPDLVGQQIIPLLAKNPGKYSTGQALALALGSGLFSGALTGMGDQYQNEKTTQYQNTINDLAFGKPVNENALPPSIFRKAQDAVTVFRNRKALADQQAEEDLNRQVQKQIELQTNPKILNAEIKKARAIEDARNGASGESDADIINALDKLANPEQGDVSLSPIERQKFVKKYGMRALSSISALRNSDTRSDSLDLRQFGGFKTLGVGEDGSAYQPEDPEKFFEQVKNKKISLDTKTGNTIKETGAGIVQAVNQLEIAKHVIKQYGLIQSQLGKSPEAAYALGQAKEQLQSAQNQIINGMGALSPLISKGAFTDEKMKQLGSLGFTPTKIIELDGLFDSVKAGLQKPEFVIGKIDDAIREMNQRFGDTLKPSGIRYAQKIGGHEVIAHDPEGPFAPKQPLAPEKTFKIRNPETGETKTVKESELGDYGLGSR